MFKSQKENMDNKIDDKTIELEEKIVEARIMIDHFDEAE